MDWLEALILGIIQGLTEFLPVSSSGHLEMGKEILNIETKENMLFTVTVHGATVLSTIVVFRKDIINLLIHGLRFQNNEESKYVYKILISMIPVAIIGLLFKDKIESLFNGNMLLVGGMLIITAVLLAFTYYAKIREKDISYKNSLIIGIAQAIAVLPGISRSGATISTAILLGINKERAAKFSFLMVIIPISAANFKNIIDGELNISSSTDILPIIVGFVAAFVSGLLACKLMLNIVKQGKLIYFAIYCFIAGSIALIYALFF